MPATIAHAATSGRRRKMEGAESAPIFEHAPPLGVQQWLGFARPESLNFARRACLLALISWAPLVLLTMLQSLWLRVDHLTPLLSQIGVHARYLVAVPLLVLAEAWCVPQINEITRHFLESGMVRQTNHVQWANMLASTRKFLQLPSAEVAVFVFSYLVVLATVFSYHTQELPVWAASGGMTPIFSPAGWWHMLVSLPLLLALILGWMWRLAVWGQLLRLISRLDLRLVASHPDHCAGLRFLGQSLRAFAPVAMALAVIAAGHSAHLVMSGSGLPMPQFAFNIGLTLSVMALFVAPLLIFLPTLMGIWRQGSLAYGTLADEAGQAFEQKWLGISQDDRGSILEQPDSSALTDLYAVVANVHAIRFVPVDLRDLITLAVAILLPFVPVVVLAFPLDEIWRSIRSILL